MNRIGKWFPAHLHNMYILCCWAVANGCYLWQTGIVLDGESEKYIYQSEQLLATGSVTTPNFWLYTTQILLISASKIIGTGYYGVIVVQLLFNLLAVRAFYRLAGSWFHKNAALAATLLLIVNYPMQRFNTHLYTESLYYSFTILFSAFLLQISKLTFRNIVIIIAALAIISVTRPTGILFVPPVMLYLFFRFFQSLKLRTKLVITMAVGVLFLYCLNLMLGSGGEFNFMLPYLYEEIICGVPAIETPATIKTAENPNSVYGLLYYLTHNFSQFARLAWQRSIAFFGLMRSYYSGTHNTFLAILFYPVYVMGIAGLMYWVKRLPLQLLYIFGVVLITWASVMLTCDDWHNRFFMAIAPWLLLLALPFVSRLFQRVGDSPGSGNTN